MTTSSKKPFKGVSQRVLDDMRALREYDDYQYRQEELRRKRKKELKLMTKKWLIARVLELESKRGFDDNDRD